MLRSLPVTGDVDNPVSTPQHRIADVEPFLRDALRESWQLLKRDPTLFVVGGAIVSVLSAASLGVLLGPMAVGFIQTVHRRMHGQSARVRDVLDGMTSLVTSVVACCVIGIASLIGFALAVIPGLLVLAATCFVFHEVCYRRGTAVDAIKGSFAILKAHLLHVLLLLVAIGFLNAVTYVSWFALLVTIPFSLVLLTVAYEKLSGQTTGSQIVAVPA